jgi:predicted 2-oxoglutarate/Fe(II)-dependent dioxygenase YbiX
MIVRFAQVLAGDALASIRSGVEAALHGAPAASGAGLRSLAPDHPVAQRCAPPLFSALRAHPDFEPSLYAAALSFPTFHRYQQGMSSGPQLSPPLAGADTQLRVDLSLLLWLSEKASCDGGAVRIDEGGAVTHWSGEPGHAIAYSAGARWSVEPITRGELLLCRLEVQSLIAGDIERRILLDFHRAFREFEKRPASVRHAQTLRRVYNGLVRMWAESPRRA